MARLKSLRINHWKSFDEASIELAPINVVIGPNGAGKSNLIGFFGLLRALIEGRLQVFIAKSGGGRGLVHFGGSNIRSLMLFETNKATYYYNIDLARAAPDTLIFAEESAGEYKHGSQEMSNILFDVGQRESLLGAKARAGDELASILRDLMVQCHFFHFHDTSQDAVVRQAGYIEDNIILHEDAGNLAAILYRYQQTRPAIYRNIQSAVRTVLPGFKDFVLGPRALNPQTILLDWRCQDSEYTFGPHQLSDGTIRFIALATLLLQPKEARPDLILIDEPELGLHPFAIGLLAEMVRAASHDSQIILTTQSAALVDHFAPEEVIVADVGQGRTTLSRLDAVSLGDWLESYSLGELWEKNVFGGGPVR